MSEPNLMRDDPVAYWTRQAGPNWVRAEAVIDRMLHPITEQLLEQSGASTGERVIDVGCGCGSTALAFAERVGQQGRVLGVDISPPMVERAEQRCQGIEQVELVRADAASHAFEPGWADLVTSRFGVMFFVDPVAAFSNLRSGLRAGGRLVVACWQPPERNPWISFTLRALPETERPSHEPAAASGDSPGPFSLSSPARAREILDEAGFVDVRCEPFSTEIGIGSSSDEALATFTQIGPLSRLLADTSDDERARLLERVSRFLEEQFADGPPTLPAAAWLLCARSSSP